MCKIRKEENMSNNKFSVKIGSTTYDVRMNFSQTSKEKFKDKVFKLIKNDINRGQKGIIENVKND